MELTAYSLNFEVLYLKNLHSAHTVYKRTISSFAVERYLVFNLLKPAGYVMHQQFNIQQLYALPTLYLCVLYLSENKQRLVPLTS